MGKRHQELKLLETNLKKTVEKSEDLLDLRNEIEVLRRDLLLKNAISSPPQQAPKSSQNDQLTARWLAESVNALRSEMLELQKTSNASSILVIQQKNACETRLAVLRNDLVSLSGQCQKGKSELIELQEVVKEAREDIKENQLNIAQIGLDVSTKDYQSDNPHSSRIKNRHNRFLKKQLRDLQVTNMKLAENQRDLEKRLDAMSNQKATADEIQKIQTNQDKILKNMMNLTVQVGDMDKLRVSMLELLENVENLENKLDRTLPEYKKEISKLEFSNAQIVSEQNLLKEDGDNVKNSMKAIVVSLSNLMDAKDVEKNDIRSLKDGLAKLEAVEGHRKERLANRINKVPSNHTKSSKTKPEVNKNMPEGDIPQLVQQLETVEREYRDIVNKLPRDCAEATNQQGLYLLSPGPGQPIMTHCSGAWTTVQRRHDGSVDFNRNWEEYATGFGNPGAEFWIGNEALHRLTSDNCSELRIRMTDIYDNIWSADYDVFTVANRNEGYRLRVSGYQGNASDALSYQDDMQFSAIDDDRDISNTHCAGNYEGGWWFSHCQHANLNGRYNLGLTWFDSGRNEWIAVKSSDMMVRRRQGCH
ncbi:protein scabrous [Ctenocephalides felis]|uniref:protein scabrous n=1 Tax=Ctenocephalides felis TaxID=7515 RepID=UPI000E6E3206|nr:protein scabrous [Ctenocephalides felis]